MSAIAPLMEAAEEVARLAGSIAREHFRPGIGVESKADGSPVTIADRSAEQAARAWIEQRFPDDGIVGEEFGVARPASRRRWIVDPIDGTRSFVRGVPMWGTLVAAAEGEDVLAGAAFFPATDEMVVAAVGCGCWWNGVRCRVSSVGAVAQAVVLTTDDRFPARPGRHEAWTRLTERAAMSRTWGDCYGYLLVATGRAEVMADDLVAPWDAAALVPIIEEAGGVFTDWKGVRTAFGGDSVATNAALAREARSLLGVPA